MSSTVRILFLSRRTKLNKDGLSTISIRVTIDGKSVEFSTKIFVEPSLWNPKSGRMDGKSKTAIEINNSLNAMLARLKIKHREILDRNGYVTAVELRDVFLNKIGLRYKLLELFEEKITEKMSLKGTKIKGVTIDNYIRTKNRLEEFIKLKYNKEDIAIQAVDNGFITGFDSFLRIQYKNDDNTVVNNLRRLKQITNQAFRKRYMNSDPFD